MSLFDPESLSCPRHFFTEKFSIWICLNEKRDPPIKFEKVYWLYSHKYLGKILLHLGETVSGLCHGASSSLWMCDFIIVSFDSANHLGINCYYFTVFLTGVTLGTNFCGKTYRLVLYETKRLYFTFNTIPSCQDRNLKQ